MVIDQNMWENTVFTVNIQLFAFVLIVIQKSAFLKSNLSTRMLNIKLLSYSHAKLQVCTDKL